VEITQKSVPAIALLIKNLVKKMQRVKRICIRPKWIEDLQIIQMMKEHTYQ